MNAASVIATPPIKIIGIRGYRHDLDGQHALFDVYAKDLPKELLRKFDPKCTAEDGFSKVESLLKDASDVVAIVSVSPNSIGLAQKVPFVFEVAVSGKDSSSQYDFVKSILGKEMRINDVFQIGQNIDVFGITRGKGIEGPVTRFGVKRKQHKSRKSVRAVGSIGSDLSSGSHVYCGKAGSEGIPSEN